MTELSLCDFKPLQGHAFKLVRDAGVALDLTLAKAEPRGTAQDASAGARIRAQPFSLIFEGTRHSLCPQDTYTLRHAALGDVRLYLVPVAELADGCFRYQAVFS